MAAEIATCFIFSSTNLVSLQVGYSVDLEIIKISQGVQAKLRAWAWWHARPPLPLLRVMSSLWHGYRPMLAPSCWAQWKGIQIPDEQPLHCLVTSGASVENVTGCQRPTLWWLDNFPLAASGQFRINLLPHLCSYTNSLARIWQKMEWKAKMLTLDSNLRWIYS